jgi:signal transduction histidine kinase
MEATVAQSGTAAGLGARRGPLGADPIPLNPLRGLVSPYTWLATIHLLSDMPIGVATFTSMMVLLVLAVALLPVALAGVPVLFAAVYAARGWAALERLRFRLTLGVEIVPPRFPARTSSLPRFLWRQLANVATWRQVAYMLLLMPVGVLTFVATSLAWAGPIALALLPTYNRILPNGGAHLLLWHLHGSLEEFAASMVGLVLLVFVPYVIRGLSTMDAALARALLGRFTTRELSERVGMLEQSRRRVVDAAEAERRRIERDLHDGAQQRLVSLAMTLGRAKVRYATDPTTVGPLIDEAHREAKQAIVELRNLTRGIHPPVLTDRGLDAALSALAARCPVPVSVTVEVDPRPSQTIEAIAYFVVAEALTNVARHSGATAASVAVRRADGVLHIVVLDDGRGGADIDKGTGLLGLADRVSGVDGRLRVDSPPGGPTVLTVELPCAS